MWQLIANKAFMKMQTFVGSSYCSWLGFGLLGGQNLWNIGEWTIDHNNLEMNRQWKKNKWSMLIRHQKVFILLRGHHDNIEIFLKDFPKMVFVWKTIVCGRAEIIKSEMRTTWSWKNFSLHRQLCVSYYIFQHDTEVLSSPFQAAKPAYVLGRHAALRPGDSSTNLLR